MTSLEVDELGALRSFEHVDKPCCVAEWVVRYYSRGVEAARGDVLA